MAKAERFGVGELGEIAQKVVTTRNTPLSVQKNFITAEDLASQGIDMYFAQLRALTESYASAIFEPENLSAVGKLNLGSSNAEANAVRRALRLTSGNLDLRYLNREAQQGLYNFQVGAVLRMPEIAEQVGIPAMSLPTSNKYNYFTNYLINPELKPGQRNKSYNLRINEIIC